MRKAAGFRLACALVLLTGLTGGPVAPADAQPAPRKGGALKVALIGEPPTLDMHMTTAVITREVMINVVETVFTLDAKYQPVPLLAEGHEALDGGKRHVLDGHIADLIMVGARTPAGVALFAVDGAAPGLRRVRVPTLDQTRKQAHLEFTGTPARLIGDEADGWRVIRRVLDTAAILLAAEQVGGASRAVEMAVGYAGMRVQFGRPIGSFQAVQHKMADMHVAIERARALSYFAALTISVDDPRRGLAAAMAKASAGECQALVFRHGLQSFGAMGFTWENDLQFALKRAKAGELMLGGAAEHRARIAEEYRAADF